MPAKNANYHPPAPVAAPAAPEIPDWVTETPDETTYALTMYSECGDGEYQNIDLNRPEFIALKERLAQLRGYQQPEEGETDAGNA